MHKKYLLYSAISLASFLSFNSCKKSFLDVSPRGSTSLESNYYKTPDEAYSALMSVYDQIGADNVFGYASRVGMFNCASDDCYAGGGSASDVGSWQAWNNYHLDVANGPQADLWASKYKGIFRANVFLSHAEDMSSFLTAAELKRYVAEVKFLRAYYYFDLVRLFKNVVLTTEPIVLDDAFNQVQAAPADVYKQIEADLNAAIPDLPAIAPPSTEGGRATQGAGKALLARVIIFQNVDSRMLEAANLLEDVNNAANAYGYKLLDDYGAIFDPANKFNSESVFEIVHTSKANSNWDNFAGAEGNVGVQMFGARSWVGPVYEAGWGFNPVTTELATALQGDPRYAYTIINMDSLKTAGAGTYDPSYQNTGYFMKKYAPVSANKSTGAGNFELNWPNDLIEIRLADCYLMEAEALIRGGGDATKAAAYLNAVRDRVGLAPVAATLENIYNERRLELATEGQRFFDLIRTGKAAQALAFKGFSAGKNELLPIPLQELNNTKLVQNPGY